jgi:tRNA 2-selenouridine synthase
VTELPFVRERAERSLDAPLTLEALREFDAVLDARSPSEFAEDHLPAALNVPVLDDDERAHVGTIYKQQSAFEAKRVGAPLVARNIARAIEERFSSMPKDWRPLVYCWRGGGRSGSLTHVLRQVGWDAVRLDGGYKAFRKQVVADLEVMPQAFTFEVVCGATGSGKSRLLEALAAEGAQVLDLELLAAHRGSILGELPDAPQPSQKSFETAIWTALSSFDAGRPVYVESESRKVGDLRVPGELIERMRGSACLRLEADESTRVSLLREDYAHFERDPAALVEKLECLKPLHGAERIEGWKSALAQGDWDGLVRDLLVAHYDPAYARSMFRNYVYAAEARVINVTQFTKDGFRALARSITGPGR